jgi:hypothetical protein
MLKRSHREGGYQQWRKRRTQEAMKQIGTDHLGAGLPPGMKRKAVLERNQKQSAREH